MFASLLVALADDPSVVLPAPAAPVVGDAGAAVVGFAAAARSRLSMSFAPTWRLASAACHGRMLAPGWPPPVI
ncbi:MULTISPECIES: hypothetical protein [Streptomyces]|uniref:Secreted protein n=1 Tax=Streptomyces gibsoniae TaxID=3075529 RepID=A0ABU2U1W7_9ACTN|nr:hypothetical protein [Streptomyces sp. DSM 41699]MDT0467100.1 hypothetical protein [Streptomyces sp. DSM 41699]